jgi:hypothetical protein
MKETDNIADYPRNQLRLNVTLVSFSCLVVVAVRLGCQPLVTHSAGVHADSP